MRSVTFQLKHVNIIHQFNMLMLCSIVCHCCVCVCVCARLRSLLLACVPCCKLHPPDPDPPLPPPPFAARPSLTALQGAVERPQTTLPLPSGSPLDPHWSVAVMGPVGSLGGRGSVAGLSCSTLTPSEGSAGRWLLRTLRTPRTPRRSHRPPGGFCTRVVARWRRMNSNP